ncbi:PEP-CTERM sorting domain-containing protein [Methylomagnum sp.]
MVAQFSRHSRLLCLALFLSAPFSSNALAIPEFIGAPGNITGISGVSIGGTSYTATFYSGISYLDAGTAAGGAFLFEHSFALAASEALYQLFTGAFQGTLPDTVFGQFAPGNTYVEGVAFFTPYHVWVYTDWDTMENYLYVDGESAANYYDPGDSYDTTDARSGGSSTADAALPSTSLTYVNWTVDPISVPEPGTIGLFALGLAGLMGRKCRVHNLYKS